MRSVLQTGRPPAPNTPATSDTPPGVAWREQQHVQSVQRARETFEAAEKRAEWEYHAHRLRLALARPGLEQWERDGLHAELELHYAERYSLAPVRLTHGTTFAAPTKAETDAAVQAQQAKRDAEAADLDRQVSEWARGGGRG